MFQSLRLFELFMENLPKYAGGYDKEEKAGRAYDLAALKYWGPTATTNFPVYTMPFCLFQISNNPVYPVVACMNYSSTELIFKLDCIFQTGFQL